jgi:hypothetical protein
VYFPPILGCGLAPFFDYPDCLFLLVFLTPEMAIFEPLFLTICVNVLGVFCPPLSPFWSGEEGPEEDVVRAAKCDIVRKKCKLYIFIKIFFLRNGKKVYFCGDIGICFFCGRLDGIGAERKTGRETERKKNKQININLKFFEL